MPKSQGFGCMGLSAFYESAKSTTEEQAVAVFQKAVECGVTLFNTATFYGPLNEEGFGANLRLLKKCLVGVDRSKIQLMVKIGMDTRCPVDKTGTVWVNKGDAETLRADVDYALETLGIDYIDIIVLCRVAEVPIEVSVAAMKDIVESGKARHIGLSEANPFNIRKAHAVHPVYCIEQEWSIWSRDIEVEIVPTCRELGIKIVAYSPLGRGFFSGTIASRSDIKDPYDYRLFGQPRFSEENFPKNAAYLARLKEFADGKGIALNQLALAWLQFKGEDVIPIPGTSKIPNLLSNLSALEIELTPADMDTIEGLFPPSEVVGDRYAHMHLTFHGNH